jgi:hypothetical protein
LVNERPLYQPITLVKWRKTSYPLGNNMTQKKLLETTSGIGVLDADGLNKNVRYTLKKYVDILTVPGGGGHQETVEGQSSYEVSLLGVTVDDHFGEASLTLEDGRVMKVLITSSGVKALHEPR